MITDYQRYCGSGLAVLIDSWEGPLRCRRVLADRNGYYLIEEKLPLVIKFSRARKGPWTFNYQREHQIFYNELVRAFGNCVTAYICGKDGVVAVEHQQLREYLDEVFEKQESVSVRRKHNHMYSIRGRDGILSKKVSRDSFVNLIKDLLQE